MILLGIFVDNAVVNILIALVVILVIGGIGAYALNRTSLTAEFKNWIYLICGIALIILFLYFIGVIHSL